MLSSYALNIVIITHKHGTLSLFYSQITKTIFISQENEFIYQMIYTRVHIAIQIGVKIENIQKSVCIQIYITRMRSSCAKAVLETKSSCIALDYHRVIYK